MAHDSHTKIWTKYAIFDRVCIKLVQTNRRGNSIQTTWNHFYFIKMYFSQPKIIPNSVDSQIFWLILQQMNPVINSLLSSIIAIVLFHFFHVIQTKLLRDSWLKYIGVNKIRIQSFDSKLKLFQFSQQYFLHK